MSDENRIKNIWFTNKLFEEKWESRLKIRMPTNFEQVKIMYDFVKLQAGQSTDSIPDNIKIIVRCAALIKNPDNLDDLWFKDYFDEENFGNETSNNLPNNWIILPNFNQFIHFRVLPQSEEEIELYFDFINKHFARCATEKFKNISREFFFIPWIATICLRCLAKKPNSISFALKNLSICIFKSYRFLPPLSKHLLEALQNLHIEPMKCNSEAINVLLMFLKFYDTNDKHYIPLTSEQKELADTLLLDHLRGNGIRLAYIFYKIREDLELTANELIELIGTPLVNSNINKSINRLREFINFYGNNLNDNSLIWWSRLLNRQWMNEFSTTLNKKLIIRIARTRHESSHMQVLVNSKKCVQEAAAEYSSNLNEYRKHPVLERQFFFDDEERPILKNIRKRQCTRILQIAASKNLLLTHLNL